MESLAPTGSKDVIDNVDYLLLGDEATIGCGILLAVLEQGTGDILDSVLRGQKLKGNIGISRARGADISRRNR
jgi:hypothetical protein